ncbi:glyceraldehyde 3-phosphate dehydrogenase NAD-binding domain-containing protein [Sulfurovum sp.]|uniref:glyceraldehyde 3-phosphate dehydrogenase NAD-binding domain-containing protein n=1 Tax=Sulfurovum sp. TaxID=1969726 RepID=UPI002867F96A|nr:glyceraldehyde 3-phosphate dehydrogenase NAD-binding domain-containing protein [Sulfurovum sp.]
MAFKVAMSGTGRAGMIVAKIIVGRNDIELVALNTTSSPDMLEYLFKYASVVDRNTVKVVAWCDNEWGYSSRLVDMCIFVGNK